MILRIHSTNSPLDTLPASFFQLHDLVEAWNYACGKTTLSHRTASPHTTSVSTHPTGCYVVTPIISKNYPFEASQPSPTGLIGSRQWVLVIAPTRNNDTHPSVDHALLRRWPLPRRAVPSCTKEEPSPTELLSLSDQKVSTVHLAPLTR